MSVAVRGALSLQSTGRQATHAIGDGISRLPFSIVNVAIQKDEISILQIIEERRRRGGCLTLSSRLQSYDTPAAARSIREPYRLDATRLKR